jgi:hypothetical protein
MPPRNPDAIFQTLGFWATVMGAISGGLLFLFADHAKLQSRLRVLAAALAVEFVAGSVYLLMLHSIDTPSHPEIFVELALRTLACLGLAFFAALTAGLASERFRPLSKDGGASTRPGDSPTAEKRAKPGERFRPLWPRK